MLQSPVGTVTIPNPPPYWYFQIRSIRVHTTPVCPSPSQPIQQKRQKGIHSPNVTSRRRRDQDQEQGRKVYSRLLSRRNGTTTRVITRSLLSWTQPTHQSHDTSISGFSCALNTESWLWQRFRSIAHPERQHRHAGQKEKQDTHNI